MTDKVIKWLEKCMNINDMFYFKQDEKDKNLINCYFKIDDSHFCTFYRNVINEIIEDD